MNDSQTIQVRGTIHDSYLSFVLSVLGTGVPY